MTRKLFLYSPGLEIISTRGRKLFPQGVENYFYNVLETSISSEGLDIISLRGWISFLPVRLGSCMPYGCLVNGNRDHANSEHDVLQGRILGDAFGIGTRALEALGNWKREQEQEYFRLAMPGTNGNKL